MYGYKVHSGMPDDTKSLNMLPIVQVSVIIEKEYIFFLLYHHQVESNYIIVK